MAPGVDEVTSVALNLFKENVNIFASLLNAELA